MNSVVLNYLGTQSPVLIEFKGSYLACTKKN